MISKPGFARNEPRLATVFVLASVFILTTAACAPPEQPRRGHSLIQVGRNVLVSGDHPAAAHSEYFAHADPSDSTRMVVCSMVVDPTRSRLSSGIYVSHDAGATWGMALNDTISRWGETWDPACAFGPGGMVYFASIPTRGDPRIAYESKVIIHSFRSTDGGLTWSEPVLAPFVANADLVVDWTGGPYHGRVYAVGVRVKEVEGELPQRHMSLVVSADSGRTYEGPVDMFVPKDWYQDHVGAPVVHPDGRVLVPVAARPPFRPTPPPSPADDLVGTSPPGHDHEELHLRRDGHRRGEGHPPTAPRRKDHAVYARWRSSGDRGRSFRRPIPRAGLRCIHGPHLRTLSDHVELVGRR